MAKLPKKALLTVAGAFLVVVGAVLAGTMIHVEYRFGRPFATFTANSGEVGDLRIGESKHDILARLTTQSFSIDPKPEECPIAWIKVDNLPEVYRSCLLNADHWEEGRASTSNLCKQPSNAFTKLSFQEERLISVITECWHPK